jgi:hypothetical protein
MVPAPDFVVVHHPAWCRKCEADLAGAGVVKVERRQVFDLPEVKIAVTEHRLPQPGARAGPRRSLTRLSV